MSMSRLRKYSVPLLFQLWHDHSLSTDEVGKRLGFSACHVRELAKRHGLTSRPKTAGKGNARPAADPTPAEIAERARECRERSMERMRKVNYHEQIERHSCKPAFWISSSSGVWMHGVA
jgi:transposase